MVNTSARLLGLILWICLGWMVSSASASPGRPLSPPPNCSTTDNNTTIFAVPKRYRDEFQVDTAEQRCVAIAFGSNYQILEWLENGKVDAAIVSSFGLKLLELEAGDRFEEHYRVFAEDPFGQVDLKRVIYALRYWNGTSWQPEPDKYYTQFLRNAGVDDVIPIYAPSHLSPGLLVLLDHTSRWTGDYAYQYGEQASHVWERFIDALRFTIEPRGDDAAQVTSPYFEVMTMDAHEASSCRQQEYVCMGQTVLQDYFVVRTHIELPDSLKSLDWIQHHEALALLDRLHDEEQLEKLEPNLRQFYKRNYEQHSVDFRKRRHFRFTLDELWRILATHATGRQKDELALVLTGGGVKAAYQTELVDHLYRRDYLRNALSTRQKQTPQTQRVDYVIGTSGGALLGLLVTALDGATDKPLSELIWTTGTGYLESTDVFPFIEMLRYASIIWVGIVFALVCAFFLSSKRMRALILPMALSTPSQDTERVSGGTLFVFAWIVLLGTSPWVIKWVIGEAGLEHVPGVAGIFYTFYIFMALYSDNRLTFYGQSGYRKTSAHWIAWILLTLGVLMALGPLFAGSDTWLLSDVYNFWYAGDATVATLICCTGFLVLTVVLHWYASRYAEPELMRSLIYAAAIVLGLPVLAYLIIWVSGVSLFELKLDLWGWLAVTGAILTVVVLVLGRNQLVPEVIHEPLSDGLDFLFEPHPRKTLFTRARRYARAISFLALAWVWWNFVNAPAIYGNEQAQRYFAQILSEFESKSGLLDVSFKTPFIISATSLDKGREIYFMIYPDLCNSPIAGEAPTPNWLAIKTDPRWIEVSPDLRRIDNSSKLAELGKVAFASGSPFPVFPMTKIPALPLKEGCGGKATNRPDPDSEPAGEWLVDGGFAHNIPINAARQVGAGRIVVISSSPLHPLEEGAQSGIKTFTIGRLMLGIPRLFPYLWQRSQIEDALSTEDLLVVALSPALNSDEPWPSLVDFRGTVIKDVIKKARQNINENHRIGTVESWGPPRCRLGTLEQPCSEFRGA